MIGHVKSFSSFAAVWLVMMTGAGAATFHGRDCTADCSGHKAGYAWAEKRGIADPAQCRGRSPSFIEGCRIAATERGGHPAPATH